MQLNEIIKDLKVKRILGLLNLNIATIELDSRKVQKNTLFIAIKGTTTDGHSFITSAIEKGASAIICEVLPKKTNSDITYIQVENSTEAMGLIASSFYDYPSKKIKLIGVTGTNGKTTTATLLYDLFIKLGYKTGLLSTVCNYIHLKKTKATHTTPDPITLNKLLHEMVVSGCQYVFMEVSSHAIDQKRISGVHFTGAIFTNITRDHLDYHKTFKNYLKVKQSFFDSLPNTSFALTNIDDKNGTVMVQQTKAKVYTYSLRKLSEFKAKIIESHFEGMLLHLNGREIMVRFSGEFNAYNMLAAYATAMLLEQKEENVLIALSTLKPASGRFETIHSKDNKIAIVDYAHTPDALANVLKTIQDILMNQGRIITVIGAGGNRDKGKRPLMAQEAAKKSDKIIITSDNPRFEDPQTIAEDMLQGLTPSDREKTLCIINRREAIRTASFLAQPNDIILIAGKGHETYQEIKGIRHHFDDKEEINAIFNPK